MQTRIGGNLPNQLVLQICGLQICDSILGHRTALLTSPPARPPTNKGGLQKRSIAIWAVALHFAACLSRDFQLPDRTAETVTQRQNIDQQECAPGSLSPTNMPIAKTLYFVFRGPNAKCKNVLLAKRGVQPSSLQKCALQVFLVNYCSFIYVLCECL